MTEDRLITREKRGLKRFSPAVWTWFSLWALATSIPLAYLMASHAIALPVPTQAITFEETSSDSWRVLHVLSEECRCSRAVLDSLLERGSSAGALEEVVLLGGASASAERLRGLGFAVRILDVEDFCQQYGSEAVPYFQVSDESGKLWYSGAYANRGSLTRNKIIDTEVLAKAKRGELTPARYLIGCAVSERLQSLVDPLSIKY